MSQFSVGLQMIYVFIENFGSFVDLHVKQAVKYDQ